MATVTCAVAAVVLGIVSVARLPLEYLPEIEGRSLTINVSYPASAPQEVERVITRPLEEELASLEGLETLSSSSSGTGAMVRVELGDHVDIDAAAVEVRERIDRARAFLPADVGRIEVRRFRSSDRPVLRCRVAPAPGTSHRALERFVDEVLVGHLGRLPGVGNVEVQGLARRRVLVEVDREQLAQAGLTAAGVSGLLRARNRNVSAGQLRNGGRVLSVRVLGELGSAEAIASLPLGGEGGRLLGDVATVREETSPLEKVERLDGREAITVRVSKASGANSVEVCQAVKAELDAILATPLARGFLVEVFSDDSKRILDRLANLRLSGLYGGALLCIVLLAFLRELRSTLIVAATIPLSVVLTFGILFLLRRLGVSITLNVVSLMGLILGIGLVVDSGIVVLENIVRLRERGEPPRLAAARGASEVAEALTASMVTSLIVFVPLLFSSGMGSRWTRDLAVVVCAAVFSSMWVALTIVPLLAAWLLRGERLAPADGGGARRLYGRLLAWTLRWRWAVLVVTLPLCGWQIAHFFGSVERSWGGGESTREVEVKVEVPRAYTPEQRRELFSRLEALLLEPRTREDLDILHVTSSFRSSAEAESRSGRHGFGDRDSDSLELVLREEGPGERRSVGYVRQRLRGLLPEVPGVLYQLGATRRMGGGGRSVTVLVEGRSSQELAEPARTLADRLRGVPGVEEVELASEESAGLDVVPEPRLGARYGVAAQTVGRAVTASLGERAVTRLRTPARELEVILRLEEQDRSSLVDLLRAPVPRDEQGPPLPVRSLVDVRRAPTPREIQRIDRRAVLSVTASVLEGQEVRTVTQRIERALATLSLPRGVGWRLDRSARRWRMDEQQNEGAVLLSLLLVLMLLAALFESIVDAVVIAVTVPFALVGVAWAFWASRTNLDSMATIGLMILIGIVVNHGIVLVDRLRKVRAEGTRDLHAALIEAGRDRMRPIVMTAATTVLGLVPVVGQHLLPDVFDADSGAQVYAPIGLAVGSGLMVSTALTLLVLPAVLGAVGDLRALAARLTGGTR